MTKRRTLSIVVLAVLMLALLAAPALASTRTFKAHLFGRNEVPAVQTKATGQTVFRLSKDGTELHYKLIVSNMQDITAAHIHLGAAGANGPVVAFLTTDHPGTSHGVVAQGTITSASLIGPLEGMTLADLVEEIEAGNAYVNVHTVVNPNGEIRGQIR